MVRVVVIGGGLIGLASAYYLTEGSAEVTVVERGTIASEASYGNGGLIVPSMCAPIATPRALKMFRRWSFKENSPVKISLKPSPTLISWISSFYKACRSKDLLKNTRLLKRMGDESMRLFEDLVKDGLEFEYEKKGVMIAYLNEDELEEECSKAERMSKEGFSYRFLDGREALDLEPSLSTKVAGALFYPGDAQANPTAFAQAATLAISARGSKVVENVEALGFVESEGRVTYVKTSAGELPCDEVVIAAGPWSPSLARLVNLRLPIQPGKGYMAMLRPLKRRLNMAVESGSARVLAMQRMNGDVRVVAALEFVGFNKSIRDRRIRWMLEQISGMIPSIAQGEIYETWTGLRPCTPDGLPVIGRVPHHTNVTVAAGHCRLGFTLAPYTGKLVADIILKGSSLMDSERLYPLRFA